jgi:membrane-associated protein
MLDLIKFGFHFVLHLDTNLCLLVGQYGTLVYAILFAVIFAETGLVATPILPGDSLLFAAGAVAATGALDPNMIVLLLVLAPLCGDNANYWIGYWLGPKVFSRPKSIYFNPAHLARTHEFYEKYGNKMIIIARFLPIIRTFAPFVAGIGRMRYLKFLSFSVIGAVLWVPTFVYCGYFFGNIPIVKKNFTLVIFGIIFISLIPAFRELIYKRYVKRAR